MSFEERMAAETGFGKLWESEIEPSLGAYRREYGKRLQILLYGALGVLISSIALYFVANLYIADRSASAVICFIAAVLGIFGCSLPLTKIQGSFDSFLKNTVSNHFGDILLPSEDDAGAGKTITRLKAIDLIDSGRRKISNHYHGHYRQCDLRIFNVELTSGSGRNESSDYYFCMNVTVPSAHNFTGEVVIKSDYGRVLNFLRTIFSDRKQVKFNHPRFEARFEVYAEDSDLARQLISPAFCDNLLDIPSLLPKRYGFLPAQINAAFYDNQFTLVVKNNSDIFALAPNETSPKGIEKACRKLIARMHIVPSIIDYLHGDR